MHQQMAPGMQERNALLRRCTEGGGSAAEVNELVAQISAGLHTYQNSKLLSQGGGW